MEFDLNILCPKGNFSQNPQNSHLINILRQNQSFEYVFECGEIEKAIQ
jgi:hypothetical protein